MRPAARPIRFGWTRRAVLLVLFVVIGLSGCGEPATETSSSPDPSSAAGSSSTTTPTPCPASGARVTNDGIDAAMGLRVAGLALTNCGSTPYGVNGYPELEVLDAEQLRLDVNVIHEGVADIEDPGPSPLVLAPGESAIAILSWRNTTLHEGAMTGELLAVTAVPGEARRLIELRLDVGTTGRLAVTAWHPFQVPPNTDGYEPGASGARQG
jgi:hypothetical protein